MFCAAILSILSLFSLAIDDVVAPNPGSYLCPLGPSVIDPTLHITAYYCWMNATWYSFIPLPIFCPTELMALSSDELNSRHCSEQQTIVCPNKFELKFYHIKWPHYFNFDVNAPLIVGAHLPIRVKVPQCMRFCDIMTLSESTTFCCACHEFCFANPSHIDCGHCASPMIVGRVTNVLAMPTTLASSHMCIKFDTLDWMKTNWEFFSYSFVLFNGVHTSWPLSLHILRSLLLR